MDREFLQDKAFQPFTTTKPTGMGLGLYNCREILRLHNGEMNIESMPGKGTEVIIAIPLVR